MSREDYEAISKIIEEVVGSDTIQGIKLLEGLRYYLDNKVDNVISNTEKNVIIKNVKTYNLNEKQ